MHDLGISRPVFWAALRRLAALSSLTLQGWELLPGDLEAGLGRLTQLTQLTVKDAHNCPEVGLQVSELG